MMTARACDRVFRGYIVPGLKGPGRVQASALSFGIAPEHHNQTCLQQKYQSAYSAVADPENFGGGGF